MSLWGDIQKRCLESYAKTGSYEGLFSCDGLAGAGMTGELINETIPDCNCLDIGCGIVPLPYYMKTAPLVKFTGIDPYKGYEQREFEFIRGRAEDLPFSDESFEGVLFATSLDHVEHPSRAVREAYRVLRIKGYLFVWTTIKKNDSKYKRWEKKKKPAMYDELHQWAFTNESIIELLQNFKLLDRVFVKPKRSLESIYLLQK